MCVEGGSSGAQGQEGQIPVSVGVCGEAGGCHHRGGDGEVGHSWVLSATLISSRWGRNSL